MSRALKKDTWLGAWWEREGGGVAALLIQRSVEISNEVSGMMRRSMSPCLLDLPLSVCLRKICSIHG